MSTITRQLPFGGKALAKPTNTMAVLLSAMIRGKMISEGDIRLNSFRSRISDLRLRYGLPIRHKDVSFKNGFGRSSHYRRHYILSVDREKALKVYGEINGK